MGKNIAVVFNERDLTSNIYKEVLVERLIKNKELKGVNFVKIVSVKLDRKEEKVLLFSDGSKIIISKVGKGFLNSDVEEVYVDESILNLPNGELYVKNMIVPFVKRNEFNFNSGVNIFNVKNSVLTLNKYKS